jgi:cell wall assembly regulator SMI1
MREAIALGMPLNETCLYDAYTPLHYATSSNAKPAVVAALIEAGADLDVRAAGSHAGQTALMLAAHEGGLEVVKLLLEAGADLHAQDPHGATALGHAATGGSTDTHTRVVRELLGAGAKVDAQSLLYAACWGSLEMVRLLLAAGVGANEPSRLGLPLQWAVGDGRTEIVEELLRAGADPNRRPPTTFGQYQGKSPLEIARAKNGAKLVTMLEAAAGGSPPLVRPKRQALTAADVPAIWQRLKKAIKPFADVTPMLRGGASEEDLADLESAIGAKLPDDFRTSYLLHNGQIDGAESLFPSAFLDLGCGYDFLTVEGILAEWRPWKQLTDVNQFAGNVATPDDGVRAEWWHPGWVPIATDGGGDSICVDLAPAEGGVVGQVIHVSHEVGDRPRLASSFAELLAMLAEHYEAGGS